MRNLRDSDNVFLKENWYPVDESYADDLEIIGEISPYPLKTPGSLEINSIVTLGFKP